MPENQPLIQETKRYAVDVCARCGTQKMGRHYACAKCLSLESEVLEVVPAAEADKMREALEIIAVYNTRDSRANGRPSLEAKIARETLGRSA